MTLVASGVLSLGTNVSGATRCIRYELLGAYGTYGLLEANTDSGETGWSMADYYGYSSGPAYGDCWARYQNGKKSWVHRLTEGSLYQCVLDTYTNEFTATQNESTDFRQRCDGDCSGGSAGR